MGVKESGIPINDPFKIEGLLTSDADIAKWNKEGLPANEMSIQNGILTTMSSRWPLCIDPQMQVIFARAALKALANNADGKPRHYLVCTL